MIVRVIVPSSLLRKKLRHTRENRVRVLFHHVHLLGLISFLRLSEE
jgi:hypothetical protein